MNRSSFILNKMVEKLIRLMNAVKEIILHATRDSYCIQTYLNA